MTEDISAMYRLGVSYALLCAMLSTIVSMVILGNIVLQNIQKSTGSYAAYMVDAPMNNIDGQIISGAAAYRILYNSAGTYQILEIEDTDGNTYSNIEQLLKKGFVDKKFSVNRVQGHNDEGLATGHYNVELKMR